MIVRLSITVSIDRNKKRSPPLQIVINQSANTFYLYLLIIFNEKIFSNKIIMFDAKSLVVILMDSLWDQKRCSQNDQNFSPYSASVVAFIAHSIINFWSTTGHSRKCIITPGVLDPSVLFQMVGGPGSQSLRKVKESWDSGILWNWWAYKWVIFLIAGEIMTKRSKVSIYFWL